jgi:hypothetical protein
MTPRKMASRRRWFIIAFVTAFLLALPIPSVVGAPSSGSGLEGYGYENRQQLQIDSVTVTAFYGGPIVHVIGRNPANYHNHGARFVRFRLVSDAPMVQERFLKVGDQTVEITYESSNPGIVRVMYVPTLQKYWVELPGEAGTATVTIRIGSTSLDVPLEVRRIPLTYGDRAEDVIRSSGMPDKIDKYSVPWPQSQIVNFVYYSPSRSGGAFGEHWQYRKFPGAVLDIQGGELFQLYNMGWGVY